MPMEQEVMIIYAGTKGYLDDVPVNRIQQFQNDFLTYVDQRLGGLRDALAQKKELTDDIEKQLKQALDDFKKNIWKK
jgi:F-type H+-transporting ATPase subunit alpha